MSWKSYAVVSGATVLAGWLASAPPAGEPERTATVSRRPAASRVVATSDIEHEAERLQIRTPRDVDYPQPHRNPFRFSEARAAERGGDIPDAAPLPPPVFVPAVPPPPPLKLAGIAEDQTGEQTVIRTAILSSPSGVLLVKEGDAVLGDYRVGRIEAEAVELVKADGTTLRLGLSTQ